MEKNNDNIFQEIECPKCGKGKILLFETDEGEMCEECLTEALGNGEVDTIKNKEEVKSC